MANLVIFPTEIVQYISANYAALDLRPVARLSGGLENEKYLFSSSSDDRYLLKIYRIATVGSVEIEVQCLNRLEALRTPAQLPVKNSDGGFVGMVDGKPACLFEFIEGHEPSPTASNLEQIGCLLGRLHNAEPIPKIRHGYACNDQSVISLLNDHQLDRIDRDFFSRCLNVVKSIDSAHLEYRMCHCDLFLDNLVEDANGILHMIDFEEVSLESVGFDIGRAIIGCYKWLSSCKIDEALAHVLNGYRKVRVLSEYDQSTLRMSVIRAGMISTYWRYVAFEVENRDSSKRGLYLELRDFTSTYLISYESDPTSALV